ncbi:hypothetical protein KY289_036860 [Solanum tuberosum]|nr:hypothetical protein KY289_036860 [Solanum tuberosum]
MECRCDDVMSRVRRKNGKFNLLTSVPWKNRVGMTRLSRFRSHGFKRLFERQFSGLLRSSAPEKLVTGEDLTGNKKDASEEFEPSSVRISIGAIRIDAIALIVMELRAQRRRLIQSIASVNRIKIAVPMLVKSLRYCLCSGHVLLLKQI